MKIAFMIPLLCFVSLPVALADPFADEVAQVEYGQYAGFGQDQFPQIVLGPPRGAGMMGGSTDVLSLGNGGVIVLAFTDNLALNGPGADLIVFENAFFVTGNPENTFSEVAFVEVSQDGVVFHRFPNDYDPEGTPINNPANWSGFGGVMPVLSNPENGIDPTDPAVAGGDSFDLEDVGLDWVRYLRIIDTNEPPNAAFDDDGDEIYDAGPTSSGSSGFDLDAVAAVYSQDLTTPTAPPTTPMPSPVPTASPVTPTAMPTVTPAQMTQTPTPAPSPSAPPGDFAIRLNLSGRYFRMGDLFSLGLGVTNFTPAARHGWVVVALEVQGDFYFWPDWGQEPSGVPLVMQPGVFETNLLRFIWPVTSDHLTGLAFWGVLLDEDGTLRCEIAREEFGY
ncbi:hypothetical protein JW905_12245 [bacterium]|nr:hypothetical protein [candidate division CSSED10-310 bacterium]